MRNDPSAIVFLLFWIIAAVLVLVFHPKWVSMSIDTRRKLLDWMFPGKNLGQRYLPTLNRIGRIGILSARLIVGLMILTALAVLIWSLMVNGR